MLKLWLVVLLGFVASAGGEGGRGRLYSFMSHEAVEKQFKQICDKYPENFKPTDTVIPDVKYRTQSGGNYTGLKVDDVRMDSLSLRGDFAMLSITLSVDLSCNILNIDDDVDLSTNLSGDLSCKKVQAIQVNFVININITWGVSPRGSVKVDSDNMFISSRKPPKQDLAENLKSACHSFFKTHFGACFKGILGIFNENLKSGGGYRHALLKSVATGVSAVPGGLIIRQRLVDQNDKEIPCDGNRNVPALTRGRGWGTILTNDLIKTLWRNAPKKHMSKWSASPFQKLFSLDLGSHVNLAISMDDARSFNINSKGVNITTGANLMFSSESGKRLLGTKTFVDLSITVSGPHGGYVDLLYHNMSKPRDMKVTYQHSNISNNDILNSLAGDIDTVLNVSLAAGFGYDSRVLFSPGVPRWFAEYSDPVIRCYDDEGDKEGYCTLMY